VTAVLTSKKSSKTKQKRELSAAGIDKKNIKMFRKNKKTYVAAGCWCQQLIYRKDHFQRGQVLYNSNAPAVR
jgi:hypothetical protein